MFTQSERQQQTKIRNFNPKVLSPIFTLLTLYREILVIRLRYPSFLASILSFKAAADGEFTCINP